MAGGETSSPTASEAVSASAASVISSRASSSSSWSELRTTIAGGIASDPENSGGDSSLTCVASAEAGRYAVESFEETSETRPK